MRGLAGFEPATSGLFGQRSYASRQVLRFYL